MLRLLTLAVAMPPGENEKALRYGFLRALEERVSVVDIVASIPSNPYIALTPVYETCLGPPTTRCRSRSSARGRCGRTHKCAVTEESS
jgi:hypothetical protein